VFTGQLLKNLKTPGLEVKEMFNLTGADVLEVSKKQQIPAIYSQFFGTAYLGDAPPAGLQSAGWQPTGLSPTGLQETGTLEITTVTAGTALIRGRAVNQTVDMPASGSLSIGKITVGTYTVTMQYKDGKTEEKTVEVRSGSTKLEFAYRSPVPAPPPNTNPAPVPAPPNPAPAPSRPVRENQPPRPLNPPPQNQRPRNGPARR
jgi:hypothetical protein